MKIRFSYGSVHIPMGHKEAGDCGRPLHQKMINSGLGQFDADTQRALDGFLGQSEPDWESLRVIEGNKPEISETNPDIGKKRAV